jgi:hypothetical protein
MASIPPAITDQPVGRCRADRRQDDDDGDAEEHDAEGELHAEAGRLQRPVFGDAVVGHGEVSIDARIQRPRDVEVVVGVAAQAGERGNDVARRRRGDQCDLVGLLFRLIDGRLDRRRKSLWLDGSPRDKAAVAVDDNAGRCALGEVASETEPVNVWARAAALSNAFTAGCQCELNDCCSA